MTFQRLQTVAGEGINPEAVMARARSFLTDYGQYLKGELGSVPKELAGVIGGLYSEVGGQWLWPLSDQDAVRLRVRPGMRPGIQLWAGLRTLNEAARCVHKHHPELTGNRFWTATLCVHGVGAPLYNRIVGVLGHDGVRDWALKATQDEVKLVCRNRFDPGTLIYRVATAPSKVSAASQMLGSELPHGAFGEVLPAPDDRLRTGLRRGSAGLFLAGQAALTGYFFHKDRQMKKSLPF